MEPERRKAVDQAESAGYLPHIRALAQNLTVPLWWSRSSSPIGYPVLHNGTLCAIVTGEQTICVTAGHVYSQYVAHRQEFDDIECQIGNVRIRLEDHLINFSAELDLATFRIPPIL